MGKLSRILFVMTLSLASVTFADKANDEAKSRFKRGADLYDEGNYRGALIEFERAYQLVPNYKLLYNIGQVHLQLLEYAKAQVAFSRYLKEGGSDVNSSRREEVRGELERVKTRIGRIVVTTAEGAEVLLDDESVGTAPLSQPIVANTGRHTVTVVLPGRAPQSRVIDVAGLETANVTLGNTVPQETPRDNGNAGNGGPSLVSRQAAAAPAVKSKGPMIIMWVTTGVLAVTGSIFAGLAFGAAADLAKAKATLGVPQATLNTVASRTGSMSAVADIFGLAAIVAGGISVWLTVSYLTTDDVAVSVGPGGVTFFAKF